MNFQTKLLYQTVGLQKKQTLEKESATTLDIYQTPCLANNVADLKGKCSKVQKCINSSGHAQQNNQQSAYKSHAKETNLSKKMHNCKCEWWVLGIQRL